MHPSSFYIFKQDIEVLPIKLNHVSQTDNILSKNPFEVRSLRLTELKLELDVFYTYTGKKSPSIAAYTTHEVMKKTLNTGETVDEVKIYLNRKKRATHALEEKACFCTIAIPLKSFTFPVNISLNFYDKRYPLPIDIVFSDVTPETHLHLNLVLP